MNSGLIRSLDTLGRVVIPSEIRKQLGLHGGCAVEVWLDDEGVIKVRPFPEKCAICGWDRDHHEGYYVNEKYVCQSCVGKVKAAGS